MKYKLGEIVDNFDSKRIPLSSMQRSKMSVKKYPYYGANGIFDYVDDYIYDGEYILLAEDGTVLIDNKYPVLQRTSGKFWVNNHAHILKAKENIVLQDYLYYKLLHTNIFSRVTGAVQLKLNQKNMNEIELEIPDISEQERVLQILRPIDEKIDVNNRINNNLSKISESIYCDLVENSINTQRLTKICNIRYGKGLPTSKIISSGYPVYGGNGVIGYYSECMYEKPMILISCRGAASGNVIITNGDCYVTNNSLVLECEDIYFNLIKGFSLKNKYYQFTTGSAQPQITIDNLKDIEVPMLSDNCLKKLNKTVTPIFNEIQKLEKQNTLLEDLRSRLIDYLIH